MCRGGGHDNGDVIEIGFEESRDEGSERGSQVGNVMRKAPPGIELYRDSSD